MHNVALVLEYFPGRFKHAQVVMIPKKPKAATVNDYRPISIQKVPRKVLERLLNDRGQQYMEENNVFQDEQFGFRRHRGTQQAITMAHETIAQKITKRHEVRVVFRDVKAAFDQVWSTRIRVKLARTGLPPRIIIIFLNDSRSCWDSLHATL